MGLNQSQHIDNATVNTADRDTLELETLLEISHSLDEYQNLNDLVLIIMKRLRSVIEGDAISIILPNETKKEFSFCWMDNIDQYHVTKLKEIRFPCTMGIAGSVFRSGRPELVPDVENDPRHYKDIDRIIGFTTKSMIVVPLHGKEKTIGILELLNKRSGSFNERDFNLVTAATAIIGIALENALIHTDLQKAYNRLKRSEGELKKHRHNLEKLVAERTAGLKDTNERLRAEITDRKRAEKEKEQVEAQLLHSQKMEAIATLAGGIAHQFNNALSVITGNVELMKMNSPYDGNMNKYIGPMKVTVRRMAQLNDQLLAYARGGKYDARAVSMNNFVRDTLPLIKHTLNPLIHVETDLPNDIMSIEADVAQMQMVMSEILSNASEAIDGKGRIRITCNNEKIMTGTVDHLPDVKPGTYVTLTIDDDGKGMDEETKSRVFEPFFTTKFQGRGLGLAAVYGIVKNHNGWIFVDSEFGRGTRIKIHLPTIASRERDEVNPEINLPAGTETILVIEDEELVMDVTRNILVQLGYRVLEAGSGEAAIHIVKTFEDDIDLVILDIVLPDMGGKAIYRNIKKIRPDLKVIVCSGYAIEGPAQEILHAGAQDFIQKPFSMSDIAEKFKRVFDGR